MRSVGKLQFSYCQRRPVGRAYHSVVCSRNSVLLQLNHKLMCFGRRPNRAINQIVLFLCICVRDVEATNKHTYRIYSRRPMRELSFAVLQCVPTVCTSSSIVYAFFRNEYFRFVLNNFFIAFLGIFFMPDSYYLEIYYCCAAHLRFLNIFNGFNTNIREN